MNITKKNVDALLAAAKAAQSVTYAQLKAMRDGGQLVPGQQYRITDFVTTAVGDNIRSASHPFDILVTALTENTLSDDARAAIHAGDTYFRNSRLDAWKLKYSLDNSISLFYAADPQGKGVIYYMMDEGNNECPYDFKNIQFKRWKATDSMEGRSGLNGKYIMTRPNFTLSTHLRSGATGDFRWFFTFSASETATNPTDRSLLPNSVHDNSVDGQRSILSTVLCGSSISRNRILAQETTIINSPHDNVLNSCNLMIGGFSYSDFFDCSNIVMGNSCDHIIMNGNSNCSFGSSVANIQALAKSRYYDLPNSARKVFIMPGVLLSGDLSIPELVPNASYMQIVFKDVDGSVKVMPVCSKTVNMEWATLKAMRDGGQLIPGQQYRITDYMTTVNQHTNQNSRSAGHAFDIIVTALDSSTLSEQASAIQHEGDSYFENSKLEDWQLKYHIDNENWSLQAGTYAKDSKDYSFIKAGTIEIAGTTYIMWKGDSYYSEDWADYALSLDDEIDSDMYAYYGPDDFDPEKPEVTGQIASKEVEENEGTGTVLWMKDEFNNECPYDFKNIQFKRWKATDSMEGRSGLNGMYMVADPDNAPKDLSVDDTDDFIWAFTFSSDNSGGEQEDYSLGSHRVFNNIFRKNESGLLNNVMFGENNYGNDFGINCYNNSWGNSCSRNSWGNDCYNNSWGNDCDNNSWGNSCYNNSWGNSCSSNSWGNDCDNNSWGNYCGGNSWGNYCSSNSWGNSCQYNSWGNSCQYNSWGNNCQNNSWGNDCGGNSWGNDCYNNSWGNNCQNNSWGNETTFCTVFDGVQHTQISSTKVKYAQVLNGVSGTYSSKLSLPFAANKNYTQVACKNSSNVLKIYVPGDLA